MLIGNQYSDKKIYRGIKHSDGLPLTSGDIHEYTDTIATKNSLLFNNLLGQGIVNTPGVSIDTSGVYLEEPAVILVDGDIALISQSTNKYLVPRTSLSGGPTEMTIAILAWYQHVSSNDTMHEYGGLDNDEIDNPLFNSELGLQTSSRYQLVWTPIVIDKSDIVQSTLTLNINTRDKSGVVTGTATINSTAKLDDMFVMEIPTSMRDHVESALYIVPIIECTKSSADNISVRAHHPISVDTTPLSLVNTQNTHIVTERITTAQNIVLPINIPDLGDGDVLTVIYEGLVLVENTHYTVNLTDNTITLLDFTTEVGDTITFRSLKFVEVNDVTDMSAIVFSHVGLQASSTEKGHVKLTDTISESKGISSGTAATPKAVHKLVSDTKTELSGSINKYKDETTNINYKLCINNGEIYLEEVE